jgi:hypothetical protein
MGETYQIRNLYSANTIPPLASFGRAVALTKRVSNEIEGVEQMNKFSKWMSVVVVVMSVLVLTNVMYAAQAHKTFEGTLIAFDENSKVLTLKEGDKEMQFTFTEQTELVGQKDGQPVAVRQGSRLKIHYQERDKANVATKVEVREI